MAGLCLLGCGVVPGVLKDFEVFFCVWMFETSLIDRQAAGYDVGAEAGGVDDLFAAAKCGNDDFGGESEVGIDFNLKTPINHEGHEEHEEHEENQRLDFLEKLTRWESQQSARVLCFSS